MPSAPESVSDPAIRPWFRVYDGNVLWLPEMAVEGTISVWNEDQADFVFLNIQENIDYRGGVSLISVRRDGRSIPIEELPPVLYSYKSAGAEEKDGKLILPGRQRDPNTALYILFSFETPKEYKWKSGDYEIIFKVDPFPSQKPKLSPSIQAASKLAPIAFRIKYLETEIDRLALSWYKYDRLHRSLNSRATPENKQKMREEGIPLINLLVEKYPRDIILLHQRSQTWDNLGERKKARPI